MNFIAHADAEYGCMVALKNACIWYPYNEWKQGIPKTYAHTLVTFMQLAVKQCCPTAAATFVPAYAVLVIKILKMLLKQCLLTYLST
jgi:hypothetical protein